MSTFVFDCPNCCAKKSTFDVNGFEPTETHPDDIFWYLFSRCRSCKISITINADLSPSTIHSLYVSYTTNRNLKLKAIRSILNDQGDVSQWFVNFKYSPILPSSEHPPEHLPYDIEEIFKEGANCFAIGCFNAAGAMFRLCLDTTTKNILSQNEHLNQTKDDRKSIHNRLNWIFKNSILPKQLEDLSRCIKDDGNDAAHDGSLCKEDAADLLDFTYILLERIYTEPARIENARQRRVERRQD